MGVMKISYEDLQIIQNCFVSANDEFVQSLDDFLKVKKDDYYFQGRLPDCIKVIEIKIRTLKWILNDDAINLKRFESTHKNLNSVYLAAIGSFQKSVFLYGRNRHE